MKRAQSDKTDMGELMRVLTGVLLAALLCAGVARADEGAERSRVQPDRLYVVLGSHHFGIDPAGFGRTAWNEINPGVVLSWEKRFLGLNYQLGAFVNSFAQTGGYVSVAKSWDLKSGSSIAAVMSLADYGANSQYFPVELGNSNWVLIPGIQYNRNKVFAQWWPSPQAGKPWAGVLSVGLRFPVGGN